MLGLQAAPVGAQVERIAAAGELSAGSELESYLRTLQLTGDAPLQPWSIRPLSPPQLERLAPSDTNHPWARRFDFKPNDGIRLLRPRAQVRYNTGFAFGTNDGPTWAGRGATLVASGGVSARWGPVFARVAPIVFWTENRAFPIFDNGQPGRLRYGDAQYPSAVDYPQRFGDQGFGRIDAGDSELRLDAFGVTAGLANSHSWWGPSEHLPFLLGNNAPGFAHAFFGTAMPLSVGIADFHARVLWGQVAQSEYFVAPNEIVRPHRFVTGLAVVVRPRGLEELELGFARFIHAPWPDEGLPGRYITRAFEGLLKERLPTLPSPVPGDDRSADGENQLASVFGRLTLPRAGFEIYTEFGREDHSWDLRDLVLQPDWLASLTMGVRKGWKTSADHIAVARGEIINFQLSSASRERGTPSVYVHSSGSNQGHTHRGQLLGAAVGVGSAAGSVLGLDFIAPDGRWSFEWRRTLRQERLSVWPPIASDVRPPDVLHSLGIERVWFRGRLDLTAGLIAAHNFNRNFGGDAQNLSLILSATGLPW